MSRVAVGSPPVLPFPRQPSPLSLSPLVINRSSPPGHPLPDLPHISDDSSSTTKTSFNSAPVPPATRLLLQAPITPLPAPSQPPTVITSAEHVLPVKPLPDSLLLRSTFSALDHSASTLKKLSKSVLTSMSVVRGLLDQLEKAEGELYDGLGELGSWMEAGYGVQGSLWDPDSGLKKVNKLRRRKERDEMEVMVENNVRAVKIELKKQGLAGGQTQAKFEFYNQTQAYLAPQISSGAPSGLPNTAQTSNAIAASSSSLQPSRPISRISQSSSDAAQATRLAQFDLARYNHHSTLLNAVPPTSIACLDMLIGMYSWASNSMGETPVQRLQQVAESDPHRTPGYETEHMAPAEVPFLVHSPSTALKSDVSEALGQLASIRAGLVAAWQLREQQAMELEQDIAQGETVTTDADPETRMPRSHPLEQSGSRISANTAIGKEKKRFSKVQRNTRLMGGRIRDLLTSSSSSNTLAAQAEKRGHADRNAMTVDTVVIGPSRLNDISVPEVIDISAEEGPSIATRGVPFPKSPPIPSPEEVIPNRRSIQLPRSEDYVAPSPYMVPASSLPLSYGRSQTPEVPATAAVSADGNRTPVRNKPLGVGGLNGMGNEDDRRQEVGRKKEGVLWGAGSWEGLSKTGGRSKWEKFWVVLDHSRIYEYRDTGFEMPENAHEVIDLKFASVREGRGVERRFGKSWLPDESVDANEAVFEIVTPSQGRRLYQAPSEMEMQNWLYAICNAIESCINGTSSVRTFDTSKLRTASGALDDQALPSRVIHGMAGSNLNGIPRMGMGLGFPIAHLSGSPGSRRSLPPMPRMELIDGRARKTSFKNALKQSAGIAGGKWANVVSGVGGGSGSGSGIHRVPMTTATATLDIPRPSFLGESGRSGSRSSTSTTTTVSDDGRKTPTSSVPPASASCDPSPSSASNSNSNRTRGSGSGSREGSNDTVLWVDEADGDIEKRVYEMAGLGDSPTLALLSNRRVQSESVGRASGSGMGPGSDAGMREGEAMARSRSADERTSTPPPPPVPDKTVLGMEDLRRCMGRPGNMTCGDCGNRMKASPWATLTLRGKPMVMFLCIRCCGLHRGLGTHISKPRSLQLDHWSHDSIKLADEWGNERCNAIFEAGKPAAVMPSDQNIEEFVKQKYVEGRWVAEEYRDMLGLGPVRGVSGKD